VRHPDGVSTEYMTSGWYELDVAAERVPAKLHFQPLYDPRNERTRNCVPSNDSAIALKPL
jgi:sarcosine dehydrogenase